MEFKDIPHPSLVPNYFTNDSFIYNALGIKGEKGPIGLPQYGQQGQPGYPGEFGIVGDIGPRGPDGLTGLTGIKVKQKKTHESCHLKACSFNRV